MASIKNAERDLTPVGVDATSESNTSNSALRTPSNQRRKSKKLPLTPANAIKICGACGDNFEPILAWRVACDQCYYCNRLCRAIQSYREVPQ